MKVINCLSMLNIYRFEEQKPIINPYKAKITGRVTDAETSKPLANALISLYDENAEIYDSIYTDASGLYEIATDYFSVYRLRASQDKYDTDEKVSLSEKEEQIIDFVLQRNEIQLVPGTDIAQTLNIHHIYFDFDKSNIRTSEEVKLEKLIQAMRTHTSLKIDIRSHTDSRGNDKYNEALSERRAQSTRDYLINHGISAERLTAKGYGEYQLKNECKNAIPCTKEQHQENRRSEFIITH